MKIRNLIENTDGGNGCRFEHGLSFYVETVRHRLLVDTGASDAFLENAEKLGIDLSRVDILILSHGHYDHGGGILSFARQNPQAKIYIRADAMRPFYHVDEKETRYIGLDERIAALPQVVFTEGDMRLDEELFLFSGVTGRKLWPAGNRVLKVKEKEDFVQDDFSHEQYLILSCEGREILLSGCAHNGIVNILERYRKIRGRYPDAVVSGLHTMKRSGYSEADRELIGELAAELKKYPVKFYTGHCTGEEPYEIMQAVMGDQIQYIRSGQEIRFL